MPLDRLTAHIENVMTPLREKKLGVAYFKHLNFNALKYIYMDD